MQDEYILKICSAGSYQVGKTSLIRRYASNTFEENYLPTLGVDITSKRIVVDNMNVKIILMDTAGQEVFGKVRRSYFEGAAGCLICYDITRRDSFESLDQWIADFRSAKSRLTIPIVIIGNKIDLTDLRVVSTEEGQEFAKALDVPFFETSAKLGGPIIPEIYQTIARTYINRSLK